RTSIQGTLRLFLDKRILWQFASTRLKNGMATMRRIWPIIAAIIAAMLVEPQFAFAAADALARDSVVGDPDQWFEFTTNVVSPLQVEIRKSHRPSDTDCHETEGGANLDIGSS